MALKFVDNYQFWTTLASGTHTSFYGTGNSVASGRLRIGAAGIGGGSVISNRFTSQSTYIVNTRLNIQSLGNGDPFGMPNGFTPFVSLMEGGSFQGNVQAGLAVRSDGKLQFYRSTNSIGAVSSIALVADSLITFYDIEYKITINNITGTIEARVNGGVEIGPTSSLDTQNTSNAFADSVVLGGINSGSNTNIPNTAYEHIVVMDSTGSAGNDFLGPIDVDLLAPTGDGTYTEWDFTGAPTRWQAVDDSDPDEDSSYIFDNVVGQRNTFTHPSLPGGTTLVKAVVVWARGRRDDAVTRSFKVLLRSSGTDNLGGIEQFLGDNYLWFLQPYEISPFSSSAWTVSEVNALEYGVQVTA
jgi:hypothetical protein